jgi:23S rRNA G2069 N7-methylase RlmK/C1962 C5-methylase RlmI
VDVLGSHVVVQSSALWLERNKAAISEALQEVTGCAQLSWRADERMLAQEAGMKPGQAQAAAAAVAATDESDPETSWSAAPAPATSARQEDPGAQHEAIVRELGVLYVTDPMGQKTGFYADQRENREYLRKLVKGKRVLDLCCYTGGFALNAALAGAAEVVGVDSSRAAVELATRNAGLNGVSNRCAARARS